MIDFNDFSSEIFQILRSYCDDIVLYDENGSRVYEPTEARRLYVLGDNLLISIKEDGDDSALKLYLSPSIGLSQLMAFIETLRNVAAKNNLLFHVKRFNKEIKPQHFATKASINEQENSNMDLMEGMYGTSKSSYLKLENARMIVRHSAKVKENMIGGRGRHIQSIFVENANGERFLFPVNILSGARAMTQHVNQGGTFSDEVGQQIIRMAKDFKNLAQVASANAVADIQRFGSLRESIVSTMKQQKRVFARLAETKYYQRACAQIVEASSLMETTDLHDEKLAVLRSILGESFDDSALQSVARLVDLPDSGSVTEQETDEVEDDIHELNVHELDETLDDGYALWQAKVKSIHGDIANKLIFKGALIGGKNVISAEIPGEDRSYGVFDVDSEEGQVFDIHRKQEEATAESIESNSPSATVLRQFESWMDEFDPENLVSESELEFETDEQADEEDDVDDAEFDDNDTDSIVVEDDDTDCEGDDCVDEETESELTRLEAQFNSMRSSSPVVDEDDELEDVNVDGEDVDDLETDSDIKRQLSVVDAEWEKVLGEAMDDSYTLPQVSMPQLTTPAAPVVPVQQLPVPTAIQPTQATEPVASANDVATAVRSMADLVRRLSEKVYDKEADALPSTHYDTMSPRWEFEDPHASDPIQDYEGSDLVKVLNVVADKLDETITLVMSGNKEGATAKMKEAQDLFMAQHNELMPYQIISEYSSLTEVWVRDGYYFRCNTENVNALTSYFGSIMGGHLVDEEELELDNDRLLVDSEDDIDDDLTKPVMVEEPVSCDHAVVDENTDDVSSQEDELDEGVKRLLQLAGLK